ncbi:MAG: hypothetical protein OXR72_07480 [Gemmatimonadota bacterium]|nr:hypothetical protein [Gemmatimonadota bacterium]
MWPGRGNSIRAETAARLTVKATEEAMSFAAVASVSHLLAENSAALAKEAAVSAVRPRTYRTKTHWQTGG